MYTSFLHGIGLITITKAVKWEHFFLGWGGVGGGQLMEAQKPALSPHVFILPASTSLDFLSFSALTSSPSPAPFGFFVSVLLSSDHCQRRKGQTRPEHRLLPTPPAPGAATGQLELHRPHPALSDSSSNPGISQEDRRCHLV